MGWEPVWNFKWRVKMRGVDTVASQPSLSINNCSYLVLQWMGNWDSSQTIFIFRRTPSPSEGGKSGQTHQTLQFWSVIWSSGDQIQQNRSCLLQDPSFHWLTSAEENTWQIMMHFFCVVEDEGEELEATSPSCPFSFLRAINTTMSSMSAM